VIDNLFSNNSVFSAGTADWDSPLLPEPNRMPFLAVAIFAFMLLGFLGIRYNWANTLLGPANVDDAKQESLLTAEDKPTDQRKTFHYDAKPPKKIAVSGTSRDTSRRSDRPRRVNHR
jgi:hypothetical protein